MMAAPLLVLYNISILLSWIFHRRRQKQASEAASRATEGTGGTTSEG
jgi:Sec-independent protein secretion pathway component TatC